jgi:hypothetical protein
MTIVANCESRVVQFFSRWQLSMRHGGQFSVAARGWAFSCVEKPIFISLLAHFSECRIYMHLAFFRAAGVAGLLRGDL